MSTVLVVWHVQGTNGQPLYGAIVKGVSPTLGSWQAATNACGDASTNLTPGQYDVTVSYPLAPDRTLPATIGDAGVITVGVDFSRPGAVAQQPLPAPDPNDAGGDVHTTFPPELVIPVGPSRDFWRGDHTGVTLTDTPPLVPGCNTTPREMVMSFLAPWYSRPWLDKMLIANALRGHTHFHLDRWQWQRAGLSQAQALQLFAYIQSWGFYTSYWATSSNDDRSGGWPMLQPLVEPFLRALIAAGLADKTICLVGEELNNGTVPGPQANGCDALIQNTAFLCNQAGIPCWIHLTANYPAWPTPPPPGVDFDVWVVQWIQQWRGTLKGICWQGNQNDPAGTMGAKLWDTRRYWGQADPAFLVAAFELMASAELQGQCTEEYGCLRGYELLCCPNGGTNYPAVAGFGNGARYLNGTPL